MITRLFLKHLWLAAALLLGITVRASAAQTVVSLTFDDGYSDEMTGAQLLDQYGMKGTYYIITGVVGGGSLYMTLADLKSLQSRGHELGSHTISHPDLTTLTASQAQTEICGARSTLASWGFNAVSFAYPFGAVNPSVEAITRSCNYLSARAGWGLNCDYDGCDNAEPIPAKDLFAIRTPDAIMTSTTLAQIEKFVTDAESTGGGWVPLQFHHVCDNCGDDYSVSPATLQNFLAWLAQRQSLGTVVKTVGEVTGAAASNPLPVVSSLSPNSTLRGGSAFVLTISGSQFVAGAAVRWNGAALQATVLSATQIQATVPASNISTTGTVNVSVVNPAPGGGESSSVPFLVLGSTVSTSVNLFGTSAPAAGEGARDPNPLELGVRFTSDVSGYVTGVRFYKQSTNTGVHIGSLWTSAGVLLGRATFTGESATGWQAVTFPSPIPVSANTTYVASYHSTAGYAVTKSFFTGKGKDAPPLHAPASGTAGKNAVYLYGTDPSFPSQSTSDSNYWVDVTLSVFNSSSTTTPPPTAVLQSIAPSSITVKGAAFTLAVTGGNFVNGANVLWNNATRPTTFVNSGMLTAQIPASDLLSTGTASVTVQTPVPNAAVTNASTFTIAPSTQTTTAPPSTSSTTLFGVRVPAAGQGSRDPSPAELGMRFRSDVNGTITGIRYYKWSFNTGAHSGHLWSNTGALLASVDFTNETASGWQTATLSQPVAILANTTYVVSYFTSTGYAVSTGTFTNAYVDAAPLHGLKSGVDGVNGLYLYTATPAFPNKSTNGSNYWVDVVFASTNTAGNFAAPSLNAVLVSETVPALVHESRVYPNPWRARSSKSHVITFDHLPVNSTVRIYTISAQWLSTIPAPDGQAVWNLQNDSGEDVASGFYLYLINAPDGKKTGTLGVIR